LALSALRRQADVFAHGCHRFRSAVAQVLITHQKAATGQLCIGFESLSHLTVHECPVPCPAASFLVTLPAGLDGRDRVVISRVDRPAVEAELEMSSEMQMLACCLVLVLDLAEQFVLLHERGHMRDGRTYW